MKTTINLPITFGQLVDMARQLPTAQQDLLIEQLRADQEPAATKEELLNQLATDYRLLQQGKLKTRPLKDIINEL
jgi:hypothetical protein